jgi:RNA polymerase sigma factor (sigma-70 family)
VDCKFMAGVQLRAVIRHLHRSLNPGCVGEPTDAHLLESYLFARDEQAFETLVWRHGGMVFNLCRRLLPGVQDAEDVFQATFLILVRKANTIGKRESVGSWLYKVAYRLALATRTGKMRRTECEKRVAFRFGPNPEFEAANHELGTLLDEEICRLPEKYRAPFVLCCLEGKSLEAAAHQLGCPRATVGTRLARARQRLQRELSSRGLTGSTLSVGGLAGFKSGLPPAAVVNATIELGKSALVQGASANGGLSQSVLNLARLSFPPSTIARSLRITSALVLLLSAGALCALTFRPAETTVAVDAGSELATFPGTLVGVPKGWYARSDRSSSFETGRDSRVYHGGRSSGYFQFDERGTGALGVLTQTIQAQAFRRQRVRLSGWLKTTGSGRTGLWIRVDGVDLSLALDNMDAQPVVGASDWRRYEVAVDVSAEANQISFGIWRRDGGRTWIDDLAIDSSKQTISMTPPPVSPQPIAPPMRVAPELPSNLDFEEAVEPLPAEESGQAAISIHSRETGMGPVLALTRTDGTFDELLALADTSVPGYLPGQECGPLTSLAINLADTSRVLVKFEIPRGAPIRQAELLLRVAPSAMLPRTAFELGVHKVLAGWQEANATWKNAPAIAEAPDAIATVPPGSELVRIDVTNLVDNPNESRKVDWLVRTTQPRAGGPALVMRSKAEVGLQDLLPWAPSVDEARNRARLEGKLVLAFIHVGLNEESLPLEEQMLLASAIADPDVLTLVRSVFVPVQVRCRPQEVQRAERGGALPADPLRGLGAKLTETHGLALIVCNAQEKRLARYDNIRTFERDAILRFLLEAAASRTAPTSDGNPWQLLAEGRLAEAEQLFSATDSREGRFGLCRVAALQSDYAKSLRLAESLASTSGAFREDAQFEAAFAHMRLRETDAARVAFRELVNYPKHPRSPEATYYLACLEYRSGNVESACSLWQKIVEQSREPAIVARARMRLSYPGMMSRSEVLARSNKSTTTRGLESIACPR